MDSEKNIIENLYGIGSILNRNASPDPANQYTNNNYNSGVDRNPIDPKDPTGPRLNEYLKTPSPRRTLNDLEGWQQQLAKRIMENNDTFVSVPPSAGKTSPVMAAIETLFLDFFKNPIKSLPFILYVVPRKQLAGQINHNDIQTLFTNIIKEQRAIPVGDPNEIPAFKKLFEKDSDVTLFLNNLVKEVIGGSGGNITSTYRIFNNIFPFVIATYEPAIGIVNAYKSKLTHIIIDEVQELVPHPGEGLNEGLIERYNSLSNILNTANTKTSITLMTGSINNVSVGNLVKYINKKYSRYFEILPNYNINNPRLNRSEIVLQPLQLLSGYPNSSVPKRVALSKDIVVHNQSNSIMIIFSAQRNGQGIFKMIDELIKVIPPKDVRYFYDNPTKVFDSRTDSGKIDNLIEDRLKSKLLKSNRPSQIDDIEYLKYFNINDMFGNNTKSEDELLDRKNKDENNILYQGVLRGFAPLIGSMSQLHKRVIQNLFIKQKIQLLFATDALGVGANVECRHLYIPTIDKFDGKSLTRTDESSLTQLVHRAGRNDKKIPTANVYCAIQDYDYIHGLIYNDPRSAVPQINPLVLQDLFNLENEYGESFIKRLLITSIFTRNR